MADGEIEQTLVEVGSEDPDESGCPVVGEANEIPDEVATGKGGCRTQRRGWAGGHLHGAVRPRRRPVGRGRPPGRWC